MFLELRRTKLSSTPSGCTSTHPSTTEKSLSKAKFIDAKFLQDLHGRVPMEQFTRYPRVVKTLSLDLLPHFRWVDVRDIMLSCRDANDAGWIRHDRSDTGFSEIYPVIEQR